MHLRCAFVAVGRVGNERKGDHLFVLLAPWRACKLPHTILGSVRNGQRAQAVSDDLPRRCWTFGTPDADLSTIESVPLGIFARDDRISLRLHRHLRHEQHDEHRIGGRNS